MSEPTIETEQPTGIRSVEQAQGFEPMPMAVPDPPPDLGDAEGAFGPEDAAKFLVERRKERQVTAPEVTPSQNEPIERRYNYQTGANAGSRMPEHQTVELDRASRDLSGIREAERAAEETALDQNLQQAIDAMRGEPQPQQPQPAEQPQAEQTEAQPADPNADVIELLQKNPKLMAAIQAEYAAKDAQVEQAKAQYVQGLAQNATMTLAAAMAEFPEAQSMTDPKQFDMIVNVVAARDPQRAQRMFERGQQILALFGQSQAAQRQHQEQAQAQYRAQWTRGAKLHDDAFQAWLDKAEPSPERQQEIRNTARQIMRESGRTDEQIGYDWETNPWLRSFDSQKGLAERAMNRMNRTAAQQKMVRPAVPTVQRPGSPASFGSQDDWNTRELSARLDRSSGRDALKAAAALVSSRRARAGR